MLALGHGGFVGDSGGACGGCIGLGFDLWRSMATLGLGIEEEHFCIVIFFFGLP